MGTIYHQLIHPVFCAAMLFACHINVKPAPEPTPPDDDATADIGYDGGQPNACLSACDRLYEAGCSVGGQNCLLLCLDVENSGTISLKPECVSKVRVLTPPDCPELRECYE
jgi:hypothetical protein